jgi:hypothetical protein
VGQTRATRSEHGNGKKEGAGNGENDQRARTDTGQRHDRPDDVPTLLKTKQS